MNDIIYLEPDAEITSVINKIRKSQNGTVILVIPRGGTLAQSIINLKLLLRIAKEHDKAIALVSSDKTSVNLANQLKISIFSKVSEAEKAQIKQTVEDTVKPNLPKDEDSGIKINSYRRYSLENLNAKAETEGEEVKENSAESPDQETIPSGDEEEEYDQEEPKFEKRRLNNSQDDQGLSGNEAEEDQDEFEVKRSSSEIKDKKSLANKEGGVRLERRHIKTEGTRKVFFAVVAVILLLVVGSAAAYFGPKAEAMIVLKTRDVDEKLDILVDKDGKQKEGLLVVQGQILDLEKESSKTVSSTGKKNVGEKAKGNVTIYNLFNYQNPVKLTKGTKITGDGKNFILQSDVTVPIAKATAAIENNIPILKTTPGSVEVAVVAELSGDTYNLSPTKFSISSYSRDKLYAENKLAFVGGTNKEVKIVTEKDLEGAEKALKAETLDLAKKELIEKAEKSSLKILESQISSEVISQEADKKVDDEADNFVFKMKIKFFAMGFSESDIKKSVTEGVQAKIKADEMIVNPENSEVTYKVVDNAIDDAKMSLEAVFKGKVSNKLSPDVIKESVKNKSLSSAQLYLNSIPDLEVATLNVSPSFWKRTPFISSRINIKFDYKK